MVPLAEKASRRARISQPLAKKSHGLAVVGQPGKKRLQPCGNASVVEAELKSHEEWTRASKQATSARMDETHIAQGVARKPTPSPGALVLTLKDGAGGSWCVDALQGSATR
eukprot:12771265-Alexandrium_andersonii.AAC.1